MSWADHKESCYAFRTFMMAPPPVLDPAPSCPAWKAWLIGVLAAMWIKQKGT